MPKKSPLKKLIPISELSGSREQFAENHFADLAQDLLPKDDLNNWLIKSEEGQLLLDVYKDGDCLVVQAVLAGVRPEDLEISVSHDLLTIRGRRQNSETIDWHDYFYQECYWGPFSRSVLLPFEVRSEGAQATLKNGILKIILPRAFRAKVQKIKLDSFEE
jgi:HSP20 family protein